MLMSTNHNIPGGMQPGDVLAGKYRVERVLGVGGMGVVIAAHHLALDEKVALKFLLPETLGNPEAVARFVREARAAVKMKSEHVARVSDVGQLENGAPYMVMEFLEGGDLAEWLRQKGPMPFEQAIDFVLQACVAVADAHALGIVHRDLKPANLFCSRRSDGQLMVKVLDFGISKMSNLGSSGPGMEMTKTTAMMGTPLYMSPEQMRSSKDVDAATDIWALGVILFELMAGKPAFHAQTVAELAIKVTSEPPPPLRTYRPDAPPGLDAVIQKCLEKDRRRRYRNVGELSLALLPFAPKRAKALVERISGIILGGGALGELAGGVPLSPNEQQGQGEAASAGTLPPVGSTTVGGEHEGRRDGGSGGAGGAARWRRRDARADVEEAADEAAGRDGGRWRRRWWGLLRRRRPPGRRRRRFRVSFLLSRCSRSRPPEHASGQASANPVRGGSAAGAQGGKSAGAGGKSGAGQAECRHRNVIGCGWSRTSSPTTKVSCDPPYTFDSHGNRNFGPECM